MQVQTIIGAIFALGILLAPGPGSASGPSHVGPPMVGHLRPVPSPAPLPARASAASSGGIQGLPSVTKSGPETSVGSSIAGELRTPEGKWLPHPPVRSGLSALGRLSESAGSPPALAFGAEPAPMGIADFGLNGSGTSYSYSTPRFLGTAQIRSISTYGAPIDEYSVTFQLNVVLVLTRGSQSVDYWIQDVPYLNTSVSGLTFIDNVWNLSSGSLSLPSNSVQGNGTIFPLGGSSAYYADVASSSLPGSNVQLAYPTNVSAQVVASTIAGSTHVGFEYNDGSGWITFDNVTFPWARGWSSSGFLVQGNSSPPAGAYFDAEWILGGPGGGSSTSDVASNLTLGLEEYNGHNLAAVPCAFNFGADTAESISNVVVRVSPTALDGAPGAIVLAGPGNLTGLYDRRTVATLNATSLPSQGSLSINGYSVAYRGGALNVTFLPGRYALDVRTSSGSDWVNLTVGPDQYFATRGSLLPIGFEPSGALPGMLVTASVRPFSGGLNVVESWLPGGGPVCSGAVPMNGSFNCTFDVPLIRAGWYGIVAADRNSALATGVGSFYVQTDLSARLSSSTTSTDAQEPFIFSASAVGGKGPYVDYAWQFGDGASARPAGPNISHAYAVQGTYVAQVTVFDQLGNQAAATTPVTVIPDPSAPTPSANRTSADVGQSVAFTTRPAGGTGGYRIDWSGLPGQCGANQSTISCTNLATPGTYLVSVSVGDASGFVARSGSLVFVVYRAPALNQAIANRTNLDLGQAVAFTASIASPGAGIGSFQWNWGGVLPLELTCAPSNGPVLDCVAVGIGAYSVGLSVTDLNGESAASGSTLLNIATDPRVTPPLFVPATGDVGVPLNGTAYVTGGSGHYAYVWAGLPGCAGVNASDHCAPTQSGRFNVSVTVTDSNGFAVTSGVRSVDVNPAMVVSIVPPEGPVVVGSPVTFSALVGEGTSPYTYAWEFDDGTTGSGSDPGHSFDRPGNFTIRLQVSDSVGGSVVRNLVTHVDPAPSGWDLNRLVSLLPVWGAIAAVGIGVALVIAWFPGRPPPPPPRPRSDRSADPIRSPASGLPPAPVPPGWDDPAGWD